MTREINYQLGLSRPKYLVLLSAVPQAAWNGTQKLCFNTIKGRKSRYLDVSCVFPTRCGDRSALEPVLLPESHSEILNLAVKMAKQQPVLFWGKSSVYGALKGWPKPQLLVPVSLSIRLNAEKFFDKLLVANSGFYFLEADDARDLEYTRGVDYRNSQPHGICLILACPFATKSEYLQALGRVRRGQDDGSVYEL